MLVNMSSVFASKFFKQGVPFLVLVLGAPFILQHFGQIRYQYRKVTMLTADDQLKVEEVAHARKAGVAVDKEAEAILQEARERSQDDWQNIRGPRPWENSRDIQAEQRKTSSS